MQLSSILEQLSGVLQEVGGAIGDADEILEDLSYDEGALGLRISRLTNISHEINVRALEHKATHLLHHKLYDDINNALNAYETLPLIVEDISNNITESTRVISMIMNDTEKILDDILVRLCDQLAHKLSLVLCRLLIE